MDLASKGLLIHDMSSLRSVSPPPIHSYQPSPTPDTSFPIVAVALIGILSTAFLLVSYYVFAIKCCLNGHRIDVVERFWIFRRRQQDDPLLVYSPPWVQTQGLDEAVIRSIPVRNFKSGGVGAGGNGKRGELSDRSFCECAVCLNEFQEDEKLKVIPSCCHVFHIDCIDIWLQNNANCPLCRTSISSTVRFPFNTAALAPRPSPEDTVRSQEPLTGVANGGDKDFVVIEFDRGNQEGWFSPESSSHLISINPHDSRFESGKKAELPGRGSSRRRTRFRKITSMGDESINRKGIGDNEFSIQPMRRSISMDSVAADGVLLLAVQEALQMKRMELLHEVIDVEGCSSSSSSSSSSNNNNNNNISINTSNINNNNFNIRRPRSFFSFGYHGRIPTSAAVLPICS